MPAREILRPIAGSPVTPPTYEFAWRGGPAEDWIPPGAIVSDEGEPIISDEGEFIVED